jgi:acetolactate synthase regulatory subunit
MRAQCGLMATDGIISVAGRAGVTLILNGSRSQKALRNEWDKLPDYGALSYLTAVTIGQQID